MFLSWDLNEGALKPITIQVPPQIAPETSQLRCLSCGAMSEPECIIQLQVASGKHTKNYGKSPFLMGKSTISMAIFNSYVKLPEGSLYFSHFNLHVSAAKSYSSERASVFLVQKLLTDNKMTQASNREKKWEMWPFLSEDRKEPFHASTPTFDITLISLKRGIHIRFTDRMKHRHWWHDIA